MGDKRIKFVRFTSGNTVVYINPARVAYITTYGQDAEKKTYISYGSDDELTYSIVDGNVTEVVRILESES